MTETLVLHLIELGIKFDDLVIVIAVEGCHVVTGAEAQRAPNKRDTPLRQHITRLANMRDVLQFERKMMHARDVAPEKIDRVMIWIAAHEYKKVTDPIGNPKAENALVELRNHARIRRKERHVS